VPEKRRGKKEKAAGQEMTRRLVFELDLQISQKSDSDMKFPCLIVILSVTFICGCESRSNQQIPVTVLPSNAMQQINQQLADDKWSEREMMLRLHQAPECRNYMDKVASAISAKCSALNAISSPHDTMIDAQFKLHEDGSVGDVTISGNTNTAVAQLCIQAIKDCSPFPKWPDKMCSIVGREYFVMYYQLGFDMTPPGPD
jgi:hypothetical protein